MDNPRKILLIQLKRAGDVIVTVPTVALLKRRFPQARIDFLVDRTFAPLLEHNPAIDRIIVYDRQKPLSTLREIRAQKYDILFDFQSSPRSALLALFSAAGCTSGYRVMFWGRVYQRSMRRPGSGLTVTQGKVSLLESVFGSLGEIPAPQLYLTPDELRWAEKLQPKSSRGVIGIVPTHRRNSRKWHADSFVETAKEFQKSGRSIWLFWGPGEQSEVEAIHHQLPGSWMIPPTSLRQMAALLARCEVVVTNDNGPKHLAIAVGTPTVTVYGPTDPFAWGSAGDRHIALQASGLRCLGCNLNECPFNHECMTGVSPNSVISASELLLQSARPAQVGVQS
jgi:heptosyltransferase-3